MLRPMYILIYRISIHHRLGTYWVFVIIHSLLNIADKRFHVSFCSITSGRQWQILCAFIRFAPVWTLDHGPDNAINARS